MPIRVPRGPSPRVVDGPSDTDFMMALAQMDKLDRLPEGLSEPTPFDLRFRGMEPDFYRRLDPGKQGLVEDRRQNEDEAAAQLAAARKQFKGTKRLYDPKINDLAEGYDRSVYDTQGTGR